VSGIYALKNNKNINRKAQAIVEFALVLPILVALMMAIIEFGLLFKNYLGLNHALNKAAKTASLSRGTANADLKVIKAFLKNCYIINIQAYNHHFTSSKIVR